MCVIENWENNTWYFLCCLGKKCKFSQKYEAMWDKEMFTSWTGKTSTFLYVIGHVFREQLNTFLTVMQAYERIRL